MSTYVFSKLLRDSSLDVDLLIQNYFKKMYPITHEVLSKYVIDCENYYMEKNVNLTNDSFTYVMDNYFDVNMFLSFFNELTNKMSGMKDDDEYKRLKNIYVAMCYTRLNIGILTNNIKDITTWINVLKDSNIIKYKEKDYGILNNVIYGINEILNIKDIVNIIYGEIIYSTDKTFASNKLTDGIYGLPVNINDGWEIIKLNELNLNIPLDRLTDYTKLDIKLIFCENTYENIRSPNKIELISNNVVIDTINTLSNNSLQISTIDFNDIDLTDVDSLEIKLYSDKSFAISELIIQGEEESYATRRFF